MTGRRVSTQEQYPWRAVLRTVLALVIGLAGSWAVIVEAAGVDPSWQWVTSSLAVAAAITRLMAVPLINGWLVLVGLGAEPRPPAVVHDLNLTDEYHEAVRLDREAIYPADGKE